MKVNRSFYCSYCNDNYISECAVQPRYHCPRCPLPTKEPIMYTAEQVVRLMELVREDERRRWSHKKV